MFSVLSWLCSCQHKGFWNIVSAPNLWHPLSFPSAHLLPWATTSPIPASTELLFWTLHVAGITQTIFCDYFQGASVHYYSLQLNVVSLLGGPRPYPLTSWWTLSCLLSDCCEQCCHERSSKGFGGHRFSFLSGVGLGPDWLGSMVTLPLPFFLVELLGCFSKQMHILHPHQQSTTSQLLCVRTSQPLVSPVFVVSASNGGGDHLFMCLWAFVCLWGNV